MAEYCTVTANFLTMQERGGAPVPVSGRVEFTPTAHAFSGDAVFTQAARTGYVVGGVLYDSPDATTAGVRLVAPSPGVSPEQFAYKVTTICVMVRAARPRTRAGLFTLQLGRC